MSQVRTRLSSLSRRLRDRSGSAGATAGAGALGESAAPAAKLAAAGIVDREFYETLTGRTFPSDLDAALHLVDEGIELGLTCNPLLEPGSWRPRLQERWLEGMVFRPVAAAKRGDLGRTSPLFHVTTWVERHPESSAHPAGPLGHFLATATPDTEMPVEPDYVGRPPTWAEARSALLARAEEFHRHGSLLGRRYWPTWDQPEHDEWVRTWSRAPLPTFADQPTVSVVIPVKNRPEQVVEAIRSVQAQTFRDWELIIVDDGSTDATPEVLRSEAAADSRIRVIELDISQGAAAARNTGIDAARGHYLAFLDSDNTWEVDFLRLSVAFAYGNEHRFVYAAAQVAESGEHRFLAYRGGADDLMIQNHIPMITFLAEARLIRDVGKFDISLRRWIDFDLIIRMARVAEPEFMPFIGARYDNVEGTGDRITRVESNNWRFVAFGKNLVDWDEVSAGLDQRVPGRVSVLVETRNDHQMTRDAVRAVLDTAGDADVEVIVVDNASDRDVTALLTAHFLTEERVRIIRMKRNYHLSGALNVAFAESSGSHVVLLGNDTKPRPGWLRPLVQRLEDDRVLAAQSLLLTPGEVVSSAGSIFLAANAVPARFLTGHPQEDAAKDPGTGFHALDGAALAIRATDFAALRGFDCLFINGMEDADLCLRAAQLRPGEFHVVHESVVTHLMEAGRGAGYHTDDDGKLFLRRWRGKLPQPQLERYEPLGLEVAHLAADRGAAPAPHPVLVRSPRTVVDGPMAGAPSLRWALNIAAPGGPPGLTWGDTHFAAALAESLRTLGQEVVVAHHGGHVTSASHLLDVVLTIRGLDRVAPRPGALNILWLISHPDLVTVDEVQEFDLVFAASDKWAREMSRRARIQIEPLHQATNPRLFHPTGATDNRRGVLFVGNARRTTGRQIVSDALAAGIDLEVYGGLWEGRLPEGVLRGTHLANQELVEHYSSAAVVLNDHWEDMARHGFVNNRLFDAVASGACVVSDVVDGIAELFDGMVQTYTTVDELAQLCSEDGQSVFPDLETRKAIAEKVRHEHSFDRRAEELLTAALALRAGQWKPGEHASGRDNNATTSR